MLSKPYKPAPHVLRRLRDVDFVAVVGPSAVGKTTLIREAMRREPRLRLVLNNTSRAPRPDEQEGVDYRFETRDRMELRIARGEYAQVAPAVFGDLYATAAEDYATDGVSLLPVLADAVPDFRALPFRSLRTVYVLPPDWATWQRRLAGHGFEPARLARRLAEARRSLEFARDDDSTVFVINNDLATATADFVAAVTSRNGDHHRNNAIEHNGTAIEHNDAAGRGGAGQPGGQPAAKALVLELLAAVIDSGDQPTSVAPGPAVPRRALLRGAAVVGVATGLAIETATTGAARAAAPSGDADSATGGDPGVAGGGATAAGGPTDGPADGPVTMDGPPLLCEPYLLDPHAHGVRVVWHTEEAGGTHVVLVGAAVATMTAQQVLDAALGDRDRSPRPGWRRFTAETLQTTRTREDPASRVPGRVYDSVRARPVWRHLAEVRGLPAGRTPYRVVSVDGARRATITAVYSLATALLAHSPARLLLTSDHQLKTMTAANLEVAGQTLGTELDGVLMAGDCVNVPDRASEWFDSTTGLAFFAAFTGRAAKSISGRTYRGAPILQHTPLYPAVGNHEVMGRVSATDTLTNQFNNPQPIEAAIRRWEEAQPTGVARDAWLAEHSWNTTTYEQLFPFPRSAAAGGPRWYSRAIGDVFVVSLFVACVWRGVATTGRGKFQEPADTLNDEDTWGFGQFIFEPIRRGSRQYAWLERTLRSRAARRARYRVVMFHHPAHGVGDNSAPALTDPVPSVALDPATGELTSVTYTYPVAGDHVLRDVEPLLNAHGVNLVLNGHSHLWNRFRSAAGVNWLETSNVGNTFGAFDAVSGTPRNLPDDGHNVLRGDPGGMAPVVPTVAPLTGADGTPLPYVARNDITVFSVLDSGAGTVRSYRFDTAAPTSSPVMFDEFPLA